MAWFDDLELPGSTITGHFAFVHEDGTDADDHPDIRLASGRVRFEPTAKAVKAGGAWIGIAAVEAELFDGELVTSEDDPTPPRILSTDADTGVEGWGWKATFDIAGASIKPVTFRAPSEGVHLTAGDLLPITGNPVEVIAGPPGDSAYEVALAEGFEGTRDGWLLSLKGDKGDRGDEGPYGGTEVTDPQVASYLADAGSETTAALAESYSLGQNFDTIQPRYITRPDVRGNNVVQSFGRTSDGHYYFAQAVGTGGDLTISHCDAGGRVIDTATLTGGGHGTSIAVEEQPDGVYIWVWWDGDIDGTQNAMRRWKYVGGATVTDADAEMMPDHGAGMPGFRWAGMTINQRLDLIGINNRTDDGDNIELRRFSEYVAGTGDVLATLPAMSPAVEGAFQGMVVTDTHCYVHRGLGTGGVEAPHTDQFAWTTGEKVASKDLSHLVAGGGKGEANGICAWYDEQGRLSLLLNIETGADGANTHNVYSLAPTDFQADTGVGAGMQRLFSPLRWVDVPLNSGYAYRSSAYKVQVAKDASGMVHLRGAMSNKGLTDLEGADVAFGRVPPEFKPQTEVRWIGFSTARAADPWGGWISATNGDVVLQRNYPHTETGPPEHFSIILQPWQARP